MTTFISLYHRFLGFSRYLNALADALDAVECGQSRLAQSYCTTYWKDAHLRGVANQLSDMRVPARHLEHLACEVVDRIQEREVVLRKHGWRFGLSMSAWEGVLDAMEAIRCWSHGLPPRSER